MKTLRLMVFSFASLVAAGHAAQAGEKIFQNYTVDPINVEIVIRTGALPLVGARYSKSLGSELMPGGRGAISYPETYIDAIKISGSTRCELDARSGAAADAVLNRHKVFTIKGPRQGNCLIEGNISYEEHSQFPSGPSR